MKIKYITIENFRGIKKLEKFELKDLTLLVGENGTSKTSILEAVNFCLSPYFITGRIKHTDFYQGGDEPIKIYLEFEDIFKVFLPDGYQRQEIECNKVYLSVKKRDRATPNKAFSDIVVVTHIVGPKASRNNENGWEIVRKGGGKFKFNERQLSFPLETEGLPKSFYFQKNRDKQLQRGFNSSISSIFEDFNWRFNKEKKKVEEDEQFDGEKFVQKKNKFEVDILNKIDERSQEKTFQKLNEKITELGLQTIDLSLLDSNAPFDTAFLSYKLDSLDLPVTNLGSGVEMVIALLFLETMAEISNEKILILIDEPELHLHPNLQKNFINHIISISANNQYLLSTHSPLFIKQALENQNNSIHVHCLKKENDNVQIIEIKSRVLPYISANEINFIAFGLATIEYYNELYNELESNYWNDPNNSQTRRLQTTFDNQFFNVTKGEPTDSPFRNIPNSVTILTYIRNKIHHSNENGGVPTEHELEQSTVKLRTFF